MSETRVDKDEVRKQFRIRGWSEETRQVIRAALEYYKCAEGLAKDVYKRQLCGYTSR